MAILRIKDIMTNRPVTVSPTASIIEAAKLMKKFRISSLIVIGKDKRVAGILTVDDISRDAVAEGMDLNTPVTEIMTEKVISVSPSRDVTDIMTLFNEYEIRQAPVLNDQEVLVGFVTLKDILRYEPAMLDIAVENLRHEEDARQEAIQRFVNTQEMPDDEMF